MIVYVFLIQREQDRSPWPTVYLSRDLAEEALGRVSDVIAVDVEKWCADNESLQRIEGE